MNKNLYITAQKIMHEHKGILASDERPSSADKNLKKAGIEPSENMRRDYRELFINTSNLNNYINGIILHEETFLQKDSNGKLFRETLLDNNIEIIIKVDEGTEAFDDSPQEKFTKGLTNLDSRLETYYEKGARLAKWRSVFKIGAEFPSEICLERNTKDLAVYAKTCQENQIVPVVEPEVLLDGDHTIQKAEEVTRIVLNDVFNALVDENVDLKAIILKTSMVLPGKFSQQEISANEIAQMTIETLIDSVPHEVPGIVFLSGGQGPVEATQNLNEIAKKEPLPWKISFSYLRAVLGPATQLWQGKPENVDLARKEFIKRLKLNVEADAGKYVGE